ncbi:PA-phosphatase-like phosphoesterase [Natronococcus amylolyticus DSM 10524]|uniref:PA-phosphatase-like phosphoesterase n=1 Tax=Natronococcus amylolyticus DSM 10524 TaxID=1227497 RepID=L9X909_9EURY|nr:phosphatase PAP2 family protein [Natronococcus amylolyticus]ELY58210.1 PA-phosphatase-like phosphoesterase [Natronococcus amylolyticus DSM 10524]
MSRSVGATELLRDFLPEWTTLLFVALSYPGKLTLLVPVLGVFYLQDVGRTLRAGVPDGRPLCSDRTAYVLAVALGGLAFVVLVKGTFALPRTDPSLHAVSSSEHGFPSGHVMAAVSTWGAFALWTTHSTRARRLLAAGAVVAVVGFARLALGIHYLVDIPVSIVLAVAYLGAIAWLARGDPWRAFLAAIAIAVLAVLVDAASTRALLSLVGTVGAVVGWRTLEAPPIRRRLRARFGEESATPMPSRPGE